MQKNKSLKEAWDKLRPGCQRDYVEQINKAKTNEVLKTKVDRIIQLTLEYAKKHSDKYKKRRKANETNT